MSGRRKFLLRTASGIRVLWADAVTGRLHAQIASRVQGTGSEQIAQDGSFWAGVRGKFALKGDIVKPGSRLEQPRAARGSR